MYKTTILALVTIILGCESSSDIKEKQTISYIEQINLPSCKVVNSETFIIDSLEDWKHINDVNKSVFCVKPGDYSSLGRIVLKAGGTASKRRYILLDSNSPKHPAQMKKKNLVKVAFELQGADYWVFDRLSYWDSKNAFIPFIFLNSSFNIVNRYFSDNVSGGAIVFYPNSNNNTVQNSRIQRSNAFSYMDRAAIEFNNHGEDNISVVNNKIVNNEIINAVDGIQFVKTGTATQKNINYAGTIIDNNHISISNTIYTDCNGTLKLDGKCAYAENAIDLKAGSLNNTNPIVISNNNFWGFRHADNIDYTRLVKRNYLSDTGVVMVFHYNVQNVQIKNNLFYDSTVGVVMDGNREGFSAQNISFQNNIFYNIYSSAIYALYVNRILLQNNLFYQIAYGSNGIGRGVYDTFYINNAQEIKFYDNKIIKSDKYAKFYVRSQEYKGYKNTYYQYKNNVYIKAHLDKNNNDYEKSITIVDDNATIIKVLKGNTSSYKDLTFTTDKFSFQSREIIIPKVLE